jgi:hypothetical protein
VSKDKETKDDLVMLLRRIIYKASKENIKWRVIQQAKNYLGNKEQLGQVLREDKELGVL